MNTVTQNNDTGRISILLEVEDANTLASILAQVGENNPTEPMLELYLALTDYVFGDSPVKYVEDEETPIGVMNDGTGFTLVVG